MQYVRTVAGIFFSSILMVASLGARPRHMRNRSANRVPAVVQATPSQSLPKALIVDITSTLFKEDTSYITHKLGWGRITRYSMATWKNPTEGCLDLLEAMSKEKDQVPLSIVTFKGHQMPRCIVEWQKGNKTYQAMQDELAAYIKTLDERGYFGSDNEKTVITTILNVCLDPASTSLLAKPVEESITLLQEAKKRGCAVYGIANFSTESLESFKKSYPRLVQLFDGITTSCSVHEVKPTKKFFDQLVKVYKLDPQHCIVIDEQAECIKLAQQLGMTGIQFTTTKAVRTRLKQLGIV